MTAAPRRYGQCPSCGAAVPVTAYGLARPHAAKQFSLQRIGTLQCPGTGALVTAPYEATVDAPEVDQ